MMNDLVADKISAIFKALSHPIRVKIVFALKGGPLCVSDIMKITETEQSNTSQHLNILKDEGIVTSKRDGLKAMYQLKDVSVVDLMNTAEYMRMKEISEARQSFIG